MATSSKNPHATMHTAGIYSDMTVDGPDIGTLVVIVDRAKNLPNRKSIGKQDPYCAIRLGKEAKKSETDKRGGQTPKWDQELRFTVHDSADYDQMKVSVFNDDKKTELIGETWVNLKDVIKEGGGQNDLWHNLQCRGRYAGEVRMEITYYDTRAQQPKQPVESVKQPKPVKRRPLPQNPIDPQGSSPTERHVTPQSSSHSAQHNIPTQQVSYRDSRQLRQQRAQQQESAVYDAHIYNTQPGMIAYAPPHTDLVQDRYEIYDPQNDGEYIPGNVLGRQDSFEHMRNHVYDSQYAAQHSASSPDGPPPPPPVHRTLYENQILHPSQYRNNHQDQHSQQSPSLPLYSSRPVSSHQNVSPRPLSGGTRPHSHYVAPTVEDASPPPEHYRPYTAQSPRNDSPRHGSTKHDVPSPASLNLATRDSVGSMQYASATAAPAYRDQTYRQEPTSAPAGYVSPLPSTLVAGMDPMIAREVSDRIYHDTNTQYNQNNPVAPPRFGSVHQRQLHGHSYSHSDLQRPSAPNGGMYNGELSHNSFPNLRHAAQSPGIIPRKSVSPTPRQDEVRRLSGIPFGPDDYTALNPNVAPLKLADAVDPEAKIIMHDGRVVDPSDHLPEHSWAPEPEARGGKKDQQDSHRSRVAPAGRRPLQVNTRPDMGGHAHSSPVHTTAGNYDFSSGRTRLQKKTSRPGAQAAPYSSPSGPMHAYNGDEYNIRNAPRGYDQNFGDQIYSAPPIPAKVPMQTYNGSGQTPEEHSWALLEEMKSIDLGNSRARRKNRWGSSS